MRPTFFRLLLGSFAIALLASCTGGESNVESGNRDGIFHFGNGSEPQGLDPHVVTGVPENHILRALFEGLAVKNPYTLEPEPGVEVGQETPVPADDVAYDVDPTWSPDGSAIAFSREGALLTVLANGSDETPLPAPGQHPEWSPFLR